MNTVDLTNKDLKILVEVTKALNDSSSLEEVYSIALEQASQIEKVDIIMIYLADEEKKVAELKAHKNVPAEYIRNADRITYPRGLTWKVINSGKIINADNLDTEESLGQAGRELNPKSVLAVPLKVEHRAIGVVFFISYEHSKFSGIQLDILSTIGEQLSAAIARAKQNELISEKNKDLQISKKQYKNLFENIPVGIFRISRNGEIIMANRVFVEMLGYNSFEGMISERPSIHDYYATDDNVDIQKFFETYDRITNIENIWKKKDGSLISVLKNKHAVKNEDGEVLYLECTLQDITIQKYTEKALKGTLTDLIKKNRYENIISSITRAVLDCSSLDEILNDSADVIYKNTEGSDFLSIYLVDNNSALLKASRGYSPEAVKRIRNIRYPEGSIWKTIKECRVRYSEDTENDPHINPPGESGFGPQCFVSVPLIAKGKSIGCINIGSDRKGQFDREDLRMLNLVSQQIGSAVDKMKNLEILDNSQNALLESERKYRNTFNNVAVGMAHLSQEGRWLHVNDKLCEIVGYSKGELLGRSFLDITHPDDKSRDMELLEKAQAGEIKTAVFEKRYLHKSGNIVWVRITGSVESDCYGKPLYYIAIIEDITERKHTEAKLKNNLNLLKAVINGIGDCIFVKSPEGRYMLVNNAFAEFADRNQSDIIGKGDNEIFSPDKAEKFISNDRKVLDIKETINSEEQIFIDKGLRTFHTLKTPWINSKGEVIGVIGICHDITERKKYEEELKESLKEKEVLLKEVHHRVKNNLQIISSLIHLQSKKGIRGDNFREILNRIRIMSLVHEQLYMSRNMGFINIERYIQSLVNNLVVSYDVDPGKVSIVNKTVDQYLDVNAAIPCGLIINELITNSIKYAFPGESKGSIVVDFKSIEKQVVRNTDGACKTDTDQDDNRELYYRLTVSDNGTGLPDDFELNKTDSLGMQIVQDLVRQLDGDITIEIEQGTCFKITFPQCQ